MSRKKMANKKKMKKHIKRLQNIVDELMEIDAVNEEALKQTRIQSALFIKFMSAMTDTPAEEIMDDFELWALENGFAEVKKKPQKLWSIDEVLSELGEEE
tara:strand:- start:515 stop:814 length:300 start_codon:yes stop_codon:yes gene_type:complete